VIVIERSRLSAAFVLVLAGALGICPGRAGGEPF
jgi:hypothetical protein